MDYKIQEILPTKQDARANRIRYSFLYHNNLYVGTRYKNRINHVYFSEKAQQEIDSDVLDMIERKICKSFAMN